MGFKVGHERIGGRAPGTPNRKTQMLREIVEEALGKTIPARLVEIIKSNGFDPAQEAELLIKLLPYCYSRLNAIDVSGSVDVQYSEKELVEKQAAEVLRLLELE